MTKLQPNEAAELTARGDKLMLGEPQDVQEPLDIVERLRRQPSSFNDALRTMDDAATEIIGLRRAKHSSDLAITQAEIMAIGDTVTTLRKMGHQAPAMSRLLAAAGWDAGSVRHKQLQDALDGAHLEIVDKGHPHLSEVTSDAWQPIETAPKDGTKIDLWHPTKGRFADSFWCKQTYALYEPWGWSNQSLGRIVGATHWKPITEPSALSARAGASVGKPE